MPDVSIIVPVHNSAATLAFALESVRSQSHVCWEVIVVDDGSTDQSIAVAQTAATQDPRFRLFYQSNLGSGAARNAGLKQARGEWVIFLDSDDKLSADHIKNMLAEAARSPQAGLLHCGWRRWLGGERWRPEHPAEQIAAPFEVTARRCPFAIHSAMTKREHVLGVGGFDPTLKICEDWDLWQRIARQGVTFQSVAGVWAEVHVRPDSLSRDPLLHLSCGLEVIRRGHRADPRVPSPAEGAAAEAASGDFDAACWWHAIWIAGSIIGSGGDPLMALNALNRRIPLEISPHIAAAVLEDGIVIGACQAEPVWPTLWANVQDGVTSMINWLSAHSSSPMLGRRIRLAFEHLVLTRSPKDISTTIGEHHREIIDLETGLPNLWLPGVSYFTGIVRSEGQEVGRIESRIFGAVSDKALCEQIFLEIDYHLLQGALMKRWRNVPLLYRLLRPMKAWHQWEVLHRAPGRMQLSDLLNLLTSSHVSLSDNLDSIIEKFVEASAEARKAEPGLIKCPPAPARTEPAPDENVDYQNRDYWEDIFSRPDPWDYSNNYETTKYNQTAELINGRKFGRILEIACAEGAFTGRLAPMGDEIWATDISDSAVQRAAENLAGIAHIHIRRLDLLIDDLPGEFDLIICSEVLYYLRDAGELRKVVDKICSHLKPGGWFVTAHANLLVDEPDQSGFGWPHPFGAKSIGDIFASAEGLSLSAELWTPLYRVFRFEKVSDAAQAAPRRYTGDTAHPLPKRVAEQVRWRGGREVPSSTLWHDFPILMYHRIADDGPSGLAQWRTTRGAFEAQLAWLKKTGWQGITLERMVGALLGGEPLPPRCVMITFDDGTRDFLQSALPLLHRYGLPATIFIPTAKVGQSADWDSCHGSPAELLTWKDIDVLRHCDVAIASHGSTHAPLTALSSAEMVLELADSKFALEAMLQAPVSAIAYPFGDHDPGVRLFTSKVGYKLGFTCLAGLVTERSDPLMLPRQEVRGGLLLGDFDKLLLGKN